MDYRDCPECEAHVMTVRSPADANQLVLVGHSRPHPQDHLHPGNMGPHCWAGSGLHVDAHDALTAGQTPSERPSSPTSIS